MSISPTRRRKRRKIIARCYKSCKISARHRKQQMHNLWPTNQPSRLERPWRRELLGWKLSETYLDDKRKRRDRESSTTSIIKWSRRRARQTWPINSDRWTPISSFPATSLTDAERFIRMLEKIFWRRTRPTKRKPSRRRWEVWNLRFSKEKRKNASKIRYLCSKLERLNSFANKVRRSSKTSSKTSRLSI